MYIAYNMNYADALFNTITYYIFTNSHQVAAAYSIICNITATL